MDAKWVVLLLWLFEKSQMRFKLAHTVVPLLSQVHQWLTNTNFVMCMIDPEIIVLIGQAGFGARIAQI
jgi:hypothetical protein